MNKEALQKDLSAICTVIVDTYGQIPERYLSAWRVDRGDALAVVAPSTIEEVRALISYAFDRHIRLLPQGERTGLVGASVPDVDDAENTIIVSMERFRSRCEYRVHDRRVIVDAGYRLSEVNEYLQPYGVHIPIDVSSDPMMGATVATNIGGSRVVHFGDARRLLLGVQVVLADEGRSVYSTLERPRKDNSSPNFTGVFAGSFGAYGVITSVAYEVFPLFASTYTAWISLAKNIDEEPAKLSEVLYQIESLSGDSLLACEFVGKEALEIIGSSDDMKYRVPFAQDHKDVIFAEWGTAHAEFDIEGFVEKLLEQLDSDGIIDDIEVVPPEMTWRMRHQFSEILRKRGKLISNDISVPRDKVSELRQRVKHVIKQQYPSLIMRDFGHLGDGGLHMNIIVEDHDTMESWSDDKSREVRTIVAQQAVELGGSFSAEHGLGSLNTHLYDRFTDPTTRKLVSDFKKSCDPHNIMGHTGIHFSQGEQ